jgi:purine-binding chemotaxis protein CheW
VSARAAAESEDTVLNFVAGGRRMALPARLVREISALPRLTPVPFGAARLLGLGNFRGHILPVLALGDARNGAGEGAPARALLLDGARPVALAVDAVLGLSAGGDGENLDLDALLVASFPAPERRAARHAPLHAERGEAVRDERLALLVMDLAGQRFALPADQVQEVLTKPADLAVVPGAAATALGAIEHRGSLLPLFSLARLLGFEAEVPAAREQVVVVRVGAGRVGLGTERVRNVVHVEHGRLEPVPGVLLRGDAETSIQAICRPGSGERLISVLDAEHLLDAEAVAGMEALPDLPDVIPAAVEAESAYLALRAGGNRLAMPLGSVEGVARVPVLSAIPDAPGWLSGMVNVRGSAVPVIDVSMRLGGGSVAEREGRRLVLARQGGDVVGLLVERVDGLIRLTNAAIEHPEAGGEADAIFEGYVRLADGAGAGERIALLVSPLTLIDAAGRDLLEAVR